MEELASVAFTWRIDNFSAKLNGKYYSEDFFIGDFKWRILIFPKGNNVDHLSLYLDVADSSILPHGWTRYAEFKLTVVNQVNRKDSVTKDTKHQFHAREDDWGFTSVMPLSDLCDPGRGYIVNDVCIIEAEVSVRKVDIKIVEGQGSGNSEPPELSELDGQGQEPSNVDYEPRELLELYGLRQEPSDVDYEPRELSELYGLGQEPSDVDYEPPELSELYGQWQEASDVDYEPPDLSELYGLGQEASDVDYEPPDLSELYGQWQDASDVDYEPPDLSELYGQWQDASDVDYEPPDLSELYGLGQEPSNVDYEPPVLSELDGQGQEPSNVDSEPQELSEQDGQRQEPSNMDSEQVPVLQEAPISAQAQTEVDSVQVPHSSIALTTPSSEEVLAFQDASRSEQVCTEPTDIHVDPSKVKEQEEVPPNPVGELVDFMGLGQIENAFVPLLEEVCSWHPSLIECQQKRSRTYTEWAFTALGLLLHFLKTTKVKDMTEDACKHLQLLWEELETFRFDLAWLEPHVQSALGMKKFVERAGQLQKMREDVDALEIETKKLRAKLAVAEEDLEVAKRELVKAEEPFGEINMDSELGYGSR